MKFWSTGRKILRSALFLSLVCSLVATYSAFALVSNVSSLSDSKNDQLDNLARYFPPLRPDPSIVLVVVDPETPTYLGRPKATEAPLRLIDCARAIKALSSASPKILLCDFELGTIGNNANLDEQRALADAVSGGQIVVTPASPVIVPGKKPVKDPKELGGFSYEFINPLFAKSLRNVFVGHAMTLHPTNVDIGISPVLIDHPENTPLLHVSVITALLSRDASPTNVQVDRDNGVLKTDLGDWPLNPAEGIDTLWLSHWQNFPTYTLQDCLAMPADKLKEKLGDKIVVFGDVRSGVDAYTHPAKFGEVLGVYYVANSINTLLTPVSQWPRFAPESTAFIFCWIAAFVCAFTLTLRSNLVRIAVPIAVVVLGWFAPTGVAMTSSTYFDTTEPWLSPVLSLLLMGAFVLFRSGWFESRVPGSLQEAAVLFVDLEDSTGMTVREGATNYQVVYTEFARRAAQIVHKQGGVVERTTGDGLIATFGLKQGIHPAERAVEAARRINALAKEIANESGLSVVSNAGLEFGLVSGGYVVEGGKSVWSSSGKTVIVAQRLLSAAPESPCRIAVGPNAAEFLRETMAVEPLGEYQLKGLESETKVFTPRSSEQT